MSRTDDRLQQHFRSAAPQMTADDALLDAFRATADGRRRRRRVAAGGLVGLAAAAVVALGLGVVASDDGRPQRIDVVDHPTTSTTEPVADEADEADARDWDGVRFDFGRIERVHREGDRWLVEFDRLQLESESGPDFTEEPIVAGTTDEPTVNENTRLRTYSIRSDAEALVLDNLPETCSSLEDPRPPRWRRIELAGLTEQKLWNGFPYVSLTFDPDGLVMRLRLSSPC